MAAVASLAAWQVVICQPRMSTARIGGLPTFRASWSVISASRMKMFFRPSRDPATFASVAGLSRTIPITVFRESSES
ncbi:hypothetical protein BJX99DRAFT_160166 [Aspergillus californicus]